MSLAGYLLSVPRRWRATAARREIAGAAHREVDLSPEKWPGSLGDPTAFYLDCTRSFDHGLDADLRSHRLYFTQERRGFGEDAFHTMWWLLFSRFRPERFLEIGVYRGQTLSLAALLQRKLGIAGAVTGISPFSSSGDAVSKYREGVDYKTDTLANFAHFSLPTPQLHEGYSTDAAAVELIQRGGWDCVYIDGNHDYDVALADWKVCSTAVPVGGIIVLDDSGLTTTYRAPAFATAGHPGPSQVAAEIDRGGFAEILQVGHNRVFQKR